MKYVPGLDGVRCMAVLMVAAYHFFIFAGGWVGVQVFFVLSGYLITAILVESKETHKSHYFRRFYWRRTLRIFPLYFAYLGATAVALLLTGVPHELREFWPYLLTYTSNFTRTAVHDRGGEFFVHFWSLAVEEQFYLVWPLVVYLSPPRALKRVVVAVLVGAPLARLLLGVGLEAQAFEAERIARVAGVLSVTQFDAFAAGAGLVLFRTTQWRRPHWVAIGAVGAWLAAGALMLASAPLGREGWSPDTLGHHASVLNYYHVWGNSLTNLVSAAVILAVLKGHFAWLFENPVAVHIGKVSYGVYVLHLPAVYLLKRLVTYQHASPAGLVIFCLYFGAVVVLATLSYYLFEQPFLRLKDRVGGNRRPATAAVTAASSAGVV